MNMKFNVRDILETGGHKYRILGTQDGMISVIELDVTNHTVLLWKVQDVLSWIANNTCNVTAADIQAVSLERLSDAAGRRYERHRNLVNFINEKYGPMYGLLTAHSGKDEFNRVCEENDISKTTAWRIIRLYLQSGFDDCSYVRYSSSKAKTQAAASAQNKKRGPVAGTGAIEGVPLTDHINKTMGQYMRLYLSSHDMTVAAAYRQMLAEKFPTQIAAEATSGYPTERQFRLFIQRHKTKQEIDIAKNGAREQYNNRRLLLSDAEYSVNGPGDLFEIDENEMDVEIVSSKNPDLVIGRPILYLMVDVYSRMIIGYSIGYDNNSCAGVANCLLSLIDDKSDACAKYNLPMMPGDWPFDIRPVRLRSDCGAEYVSYNLERICNELGIQHEMATPGVGSNKGIVEQLFHEIQSAIRPLTEHKGGISTRHDSDHYTTAVLTLDEMESIVISHILLHNRSYMEAYPRDEDMLKAGITPIPTILWQYGITKWGNPRVIGNHDLFRYSLLLPVKATVSRKGIEYKKLKYWNPTDTDLHTMAVKAQNKKEALVSARIDPRRIDRLYYLDGNNHVQYAPLNFQKTGMSYFVGCGLKEYEEWDKAKRLNDTAGKVHNLHRKTAVQKRSSDIIAQAEKERGISKEKRSVKDIRENRSEEKRLHDRNNRIFDDRIGLADDTEDEPESINEYTERDTDRCAALSCNTPFVPNIDDDDDEDDELIVETSMANAVERLNKKH